MDEQREIEELTDEIASLIMLAEVMQDALRARGGNAPPVWEIVESLMF